MKKRSPENLKDSVKRLSGEYEAGPFAAERIGISFSQIRSI
ncbi:hypothetical protein AtDm6_3297 [Acetobacter tropicalis]|uniref:Uncharacterized protein n=1 Tax=Acetobacter tropicalis TaxID=104102 RepID=A0A094YHX4_9PROT|nr:hypothetical protein AtDm6_3297 [Acetobacter tropicalis]